LVAAIGALMAQSLESLDLDALAGEFYERAVATPPAHLCRYGRLAACRTSTFSRVITCAAGPVPGLRWRFTASRAPRQASGEPASSTACMSVIVTFRSSG
jgi:hypothetical protein